MGLIREPKGVDFFVESRPLTDEERHMISAYIQKEKIKREKKVAKAKQISSKSASMHL